MVENTLNTTEGPSTVLEHEKTLEKSKLKKPKSFSKKSKKDDLEWSKDDTEGDIDSDGEWESEDPVSKGDGDPSTWDPEKFDEQTNGSWKEQNGPRRVQDLPSPTLADVPPEQRKLPSDEDEEWPFQSACAFEEKNRRRRTKSHQNAPPPTLGSTTASTSDSVGSKQKARRVQRRHVGSA